MAGEHNGHRSRMKRKYIEHGAESFENHELIEMLLYYAYPRVDTNLMAHRVLDEFGGSLTALTSERPDKIAEICGISENAAVLLSLVGEINSRMAFEKWSAKVVLDKPHIAGEYARSLLDNSPVEQLYVICLNSTLAVIKTVCIAEGLADAAFVDIRKVVSTALKYNASGIILAHNHPGGSLKPSFNDIKFTGECLRALNAIKIELNDHIIVANGEYLSFSGEHILRKKGEDDNE